MEAQPTRTNLLTLQPLMRIELFIASLFPATGILLITVLSTRLVISNFIWTFIVLSLLCAIIIFFAEFALISMMQRATKRQFSDLIAVCQAYLAGNKELRAIVYGDTELTTALAKALNSLLDFTAAQEKNYIAQKAASEINEEPLKKRLRQFILEIAPVMNADLHIQAEDVVGDTGTIIDICNYIAREFIQHIKLTRSATTLITDTTREIIDRSIDLAQTSETLMRGFSQTTEKVEKLVAFIQRLSSVLQLYIDDIQEISQTPLLTPGDNPSTQGSAHHSIIEDDTFLVDNLHNQPKANASQQVRLLEETLSALQEHTIAAESIIEEFYNFAQGMHHSNTGVLNMVERISLLVNLAEQWGNSTAVFQFPEDDYQNHPLHTHTAEIDGIRY